MHPYSLVCVCEISNIYESEMQGHVILYCADDREGSGCTLFPFLCNVHVDLGPAFKQLHSYVDDLAQVCSVVHFSDTHAATQHLIVVFMCSI